MGKILGLRVTGYIELTEYPDFPEPETPTKADCAGYKYISMKQLCLISKTYGNGSSRACNAFGGDNGDKPVQLDRQAWIWRQPSHRIKKFVLISAVEEYFREVGVDWK